MDTTEAGRRGGRNSRKNLTPAAAGMLAKKAASARWKAYYGANPDKLKAKRARLRKKRLYDE